MIATYKILIQYYMIVKNTGGKQEIQKMFEWSWAAKEEYYISISKKFKVIRPKERNERKWSFEENFHQKRYYSALYTV